MSEPDSGDLPRGKKKLLYRWKPTTKTTLKVMETPEEYAVFKLSETYGGCIIYYHVTESGAEAVGAKLPKEY